MKKERHALEKDSIASHTLFVKSFEKTTNQYSSFTEYNRRKESARACAKGSALHG
jgi:hypothetical protein